MYEFAFSRVLLPHNFRVKITNKLIRHDKLKLLSFLFSIISYVFSPNLTPCSHKQNLSKFDRKYDSIGLNWTSLPKIILFGSGLVVLLWISLLHSCNEVKYITFDTNLNLMKKKSMFSAPEHSCYFGCS